MGRPRRVTLGGYVDHVPNRANGRPRIFKKKDDFAAFEAMLAERVDMRICGCCILSDHWLLWPRKDAELSDDVLAVADQDRIGNSIRRGAPLGEPGWVRRTAAKLKRESTLKPRRRPRKSTGHV